MYMILFLCRKDVARHVSLLGGQPSTHCCGILVFPMGSVSHAKYTFGQSVILRKVLNLAKKIDDGAPLLSRVGLPSLLHSNLVVIIVFVYIVRCCPVHSFLLSLLGHRPVAPKSLKVRRTSAFVVLRTNKKRKGRSC